MRIPFNKAYQFEREEKLVLESLRSGRVCGNNRFVGECQSLLKERYGLEHTFLVPSCTAAMEMGAVLAGIEPGDEVILPSYTFTSTANAVVLLGGIPRFCDVDPVTLNMDPEKVEELITPKTKMLLPIDYAGIPCEIGRIREIAEKHNLIVMQDAAQSFHSTYEGKPVGQHFPLVAYSFHETKNFSCGEGGILVVNNPEWVERAHFVQEKGTDRSLVIQGLRSKYHWVDVGSSYLLSDLLAAILLVQLEEAEFIVAQRKNIVDGYQKVFAPYQEVANLSIPTVDDKVNWNNHAFWVVFDKPEQREKFIDAARAKDISPYIGYMPLHSSPMGKKFGYSAEDLPVTNHVGKCVVRLPLYTSLQGADLEYTLDTFSEILKEMYGSCS